MIDPDQGHVVVSGILGHDQARLTQGLVAEQRSVGELEQDVKKIVAVPVGFGSDAAREAGGGDRALAATQAVMDAIKERLEHDFGIHHTTIQFECNHCGQCVDAFEGGVPPFRVDPVDTTAAGDVFNGALAVALAERRPLPDALRFAQAAAAISVTRPGAQPSAPTREEILDLLE